MPNQNKTLVWEAPEFKHYEKNLAWYTTLVATAILIIGFFVVTGDYFAAVTMGIVTGMIVFFSRQTPGLVEVEINNNHIRFGNMMFIYKHLKSFWVVNNPNHKTLNLETTTFFNNLIIIELEEQDPEEVRQLLLQHLPEHPQKIHETFAQKVMHIFKF
ncbi:MAG: hypothetical protein JNN11_04605 [Candidatus Doudnabacteria bacterium]|nr:hypothetical protein [Candidatus Doudnabacteria bacterium]